MPRLDKDRLTASELSGLGECCAKRAQERRASFCIRRRKRLGAHEEANRGRHITAAEGEKAATPEVGARAVCERLQLVRLITQLAAVANGLLEVIAEELVGRRLRRIKPVGQPLVELGARRLR